MENGDSGAVRTVPPDAPALPRRRLGAWLIRVNKPAVTPPASVRKPGQVRRPNTFWAGLAACAVGLGVLGIIAVGFRGSLGALRDAALAAHIEAQAAGLYWIGVDGLIVVAIIAALVLRNNREARRYCLGIVAVFTFASWLLNYLHGLGWFTPSTPGGQVANPPWQVVLVIASLIIGTIFFGTHLLVYVLRHLFPGTPLDQGEDGQKPVTETASEVEDGVPAKRPSEGVSRSPEDDLKERKKWCGVAYELFLDKNEKISNATLAKAFQISARQVGYVRTDIDEERRERADREDAEKRAAETVTTLLGAADTADPNSVIGRTEAVSVNGNKPNPSLERSSS